MAETPASAKTVEVYDPERKAVVEVPADQEKLLADAGYKTGPAAGLEERMDGWEGTLASALLGAGRKASFGASDFLVPQSLKQVQRHVEALHPVAKELGGVPAWMARQGLLAEVGGAPGAILGAAASGAMEQAGEAAKYQHPVTAERLVQGALWSAAMEGLAQGAGVALKNAVPAGRAALDKLAKYLPREVSQVVDELPEMAGETLHGPVPVENPALPRDVPSGAFVPPLSKDAELATALMAPKVISGPVLAANRGIPALLNKLERVHGAFGEALEGPMQAASSVVTGILQAGGQAVQGARIRDLDKEYEAASAAVSRAVADPEGLESSLHDRYGHVFDDHPVLYGQAVAHTSAIAATLEGLLPKDPRDPALIHTFDPPRSVKAKWMRMYHDSVNPEALQNPYPELISVYKQTQPETLRLIQESLLSAIQDPKVSAKLTTAQARKISIILEQPVRPETSQQFIARMQKTATASGNQDQQTQKPQSGGGLPAPGAKISNQAALMYAPQMMQQRMGIGQ